MSTYEELKKGGRLQYLGKDVSVEMDKEELIEVICCLFDDNKRLREDYFGAQQGQIDLMRDMAKMATS